MAKYNYTKRLPKSNRGSAAKFPAQTKVNKPVKKIMKKKYVPPVIKNKDAIMTLSRQVKDLQNQRLGEIQSHTQFAEITGVNLPLSSNPILFGLNNFYDQAVYRGTLNAGVPSYASVGTLARQTFRSDLNDEFEWNARRNSDTVSFVEYKPVFTRLNLFFYFTNTSINFDPVTVRVTILKIKPYLSSNKLAVDLPATLGSYRWLATSPWAGRNYFDKKYHTVLYDKWVNVARTAANSTNLVRTCRIDWKYDASMVLKPDIDPTTGQTFWTNTKTADQIWCLISTDADAVLNTVKIGKFDVWRDPHGV